MQDADADFFALGGHSLLAMKLAAQLRSTVCPSGDAGQVMVASTVAKLATIIDGEEDSTDAWDSETILPLREGNGPTLFCFHPASGFAWQFSACSRYLDPQWSIIGIQSPRPHGPMQTAANLDEVCEAHLAMLFEQQPHGPDYLLGLFTWRYAGAGIAARLRARGEQVAFLACWIPGRQKRKTGRKEANGLDPEVLAEINREREAFLAAQAGKYFNGVVYHH